LVTAAKPFARYGAVKGALASSFAAAEPHHVSECDPSDELSAVQDKFVMNVHEAAESVMPYCHAWGGGSVLPFGV
jgi:hypothetical protein